MSTEQPGNPAEQQPESTLGNATFVKGKWFCACRLAARCRTATKNSVHQGKRFWRCANVDDRQCSFFLWVVHEPQAKEWLRISQPNSNPQAPLRQGQDQGTPFKGNNNDREDSEMETPFTKAKRRRKAPSDPPKETTGDAVNGQNNTGGGDPFITATGPETPNKAARASDISTPTSRFAQKLKIGASPLYPSIPDLGSFDAQAEHAPGQLDASPILTRDGSGTSDVSSTVLDLIRGDGIDLKPSTKIQIRHEIDLAVDVARAKVQRYEETIHKLHERIEELEKLVVHLVD